MDCGVKDGLLSEGWAVGRTVVRCMDLVRGMDYVDYVVSGTLTCHPPTPLRTTGKVVGRTSKVWPGS